MEKWIDTTCKIGQGGECCKYLVVGSKGFECMKVKAENKEVIDRDWKTTPHIAQGDNCEGISDSNILNPPS